MKFLNFDKVLCLSPHPDDVEYSMGGTILKYTDTVFDILCLSKGGDFDITTSSHRQSEMYNFWEGVPNVNVLFSERNLQDENEAYWIHIIETIYLHHLCIFIPPWQDSHFEHRFVSNFGFALTRIKPCTVIEYMTPSTLYDWIPNLFVDISSTYLRKIQQLSTFSSQINRPYFHSETVHNFHKNFQCSKKGINIVEQFNIKQIFQ